MSYRFTSGRITVKEAVYWLNLRHEGPNALGQITWGNFGVEYAFQLDNYEGAR